jgi:hypothetical protein
MIQNQISNYTEYNRTPQIFSYVKNKITIDNPKILSFGCSTGLETRTLAEKYFKNSIIHGLDIDKDIIKNNILQNNNPNILYYDDINTIDNDYDIIFCMSVLCRWPAELQQSYEFNTFENTLSIVDKKLKVNGYIVIYNSQYIIDDTILFDRYTPLITENIDTGFVFKYDKYKQKLNKQYPHILFKKNKDICETSIQYNSVIYPQKKNFAVMWANTSNLGDDIQTLAAINYLKKHNINEFEYINREELSKYSGPNVHLIMNGWFMHNINNFPPSKHITPIFVSFHCANEKLISNSIKYFKQYEPIGCRDLTTVSMFKKYGINAYFTGCLTLTFDKVNDKNDDIYIIDVNTCNYIPKVNLDIASIDYKEHIIHDIYDESIKNNIHKRLEIAEALLNKYGRAKLVITTRLHCALPCRAFGTNVKFIHRDFNSDKRFIGLEYILNGSDRIDTAGESISYDAILKIKDNFKGLSDLLNE